MERRRLLGALPLIGLSGCLRLTEGSTTDSQVGDETASSTRTLAPTETQGVASTDISSDSPTATSTDTPSESPSSNTEGNSEKQETNENFPIGMSKSGVSGVLADAYEDALAQKPSYTIEINKNEVGKYENSVKHIIEDNKRALQTGTRQNRPFEKFWDESHQLGRVKFNGEYRYSDNSVPWRFPLNWLARTRLIRSQLKAGEFGNPTRDTSSGETIFKTSSSDVTDPQPILDRWSWFDGDRVDDFSAKLQVREDNTIKLYESSVTLVGDSVLTIEFDLRTHSFGSSTVSEPDWADTARSRAPKLATERRSDDHLIITHSGGQAIPKETNVILEASTGDYGGRESLADTVSEGDKLWIWREGDNMWASIGEPADSNPDQLNSQDVIILRLLPVSFFTKRSSQF